MKMIVEERKRFFTALILSGIFHGVILIALGFWSLKIPAPPELPPLLTVTITPETRVAEKTVVPEQAESAAEQVPAKKEAVKQPEKEPAVNTPVPAPRRITEKTVEVKPSEPVKKSDYVAEIPASRAGDDSQFWKDLQAAETNTRPVPPGGTSKVEYDRSSLSETATASPQNAEENSESSILSPDEEKELDKLASSLDASNPDSRQSTASNEAGTEKKIETASVFIPDNATLLLDRGNSARRPIAPLNLDIPQELLSQMDRDGSVTVEFTLTPEGRIIQPFVKRSSVDAEIDTEILEAVRKWSFTSDPGASGNITGEITIFFKVNKE